jgi:hypothetical protein
MGSKLSTRGQRSVDSSLCPFDVPLARREPTPRRCLELDVRERCFSSGRPSGSVKSMRFGLRPTSALVLAGAVVLSLSGCASASNQSFDSHVPTTAGTPSLPPPEGETQDDAPALGEFDQQLPLFGDFVSQAAETVGSVEIARRSDGTVWVTLTNLRTGTSPNLRLHLNEGALVKNAEGAWTVDAGHSYEMPGGVSASAGTQEFEIPDSRLMNAIGSITIFDYSPPDYLNFGSAALG